jgi:protein-disulfide isomerase
MVLSMVQTSISLMEIMFYLKRQKYITKNKLNFSLYATLLVSVFILFGMSSQSVSAQEIPSWIKNTAGWWAEDKINENDFVKGIEYLIQNEILKIPQTQISKTQESPDIPPWIKNTAGWWARNQISDTDFVNGIQYLISQEIVSVTNPSQELRESTIQKIGTFDISKAGSVEGYDDAAFTIIMFSDYQCEKCALWFQHEKNLLTEELIDSGKARFYHLDFPFLGEDSFLASEASHCANDQNRYADYQKILYEKQNGINNGWASHDSLVGYAEDLGLDIKQFDSCLLWDKHKLQVQHNKEVGSFHGVVGTPVFFIINSDDTTKKITGPQPPMIFQKVINELESN